jgi:hypothetical protein
MLESGEEITLSQRWTLDPGSTMIRRGQFVNMRPALLSEMDNLFWLFGETLDLAAADFGQV